MSAARQTLIYNLFLRQEFSRAFWHIKGKIKKEFPKTILESIEDEIEVPVENTEEQILMEINKLYEF